MYSQPLQTTPPPFPGHKTGRLRRVWVAAPQSPTWPGRRVQSHPLGLGCTAGLTPHHRPGGPQLLESHAPAPPPAGNRCSCPKTPQPPNPKQVSHLPGQTMPAQADPPVQWDPRGAEGIKGRRRTKACPWPGRPTGAGRGTGRGAAPWAAPAASPPEEEMWVSYFYLIASEARQEPRPQGRCGDRRRAKGDALPASDHPEERQAPPTPGRAYNSQRAPRPRPHSPPQPEPRGTPGRVVPHAPHTLTPPIPGGGSAALTSTMRAHCVPLPAPGPPRTKTTTGFMRRRRRRRRSSRTTAAAGRRLTGGRGTGGERRAPRPELGMKLRQSRRRC